MAGLRWRLKQKLAKPGRFYGGEGTIHQTGWLDVATHKGTVVSVWFRCQQLPFKTTEVDKDRAQTLLAHSWTDDNAVHYGRELGVSSHITGVEVVDS